MFRLEELMVPLTIGLCIFCVIDALMADADAVRNLPKTAWVFIVLLFPLVGSIAWLAAGRPDGRPHRPAAFERSAAAFPEYDRPGRAAAVDPQADQDFLQKVRERAEQQREVERQRRRKLQDPDS